jgi:hypothetical protein
MTLEPCPFCGRAAYRFNGGPVHRREPWAACYGTLAGAEHEYIAMPAAAWNTRSPNTTAPGAELGSEEVVEKVLALVNEHIVKSMPRTVQVAFSKDLRAALATPGGTDD